MKKTAKSTPNPHIIAEPTTYTPTQKQIDALARRLMPEIKKFFADEQIQKEFAEWQTKQNAESIDK